MDRRSEVTRLLAASRQGEPEALEALMPLLYDELHALARRRMSSERKDHTLQATALVHEAWMKLADQREDFESRDHFMALAATVMRRILVNHAHAKHAQKRGGELERVTLDESSASLAGAALDVLALDEALAKLSVAFPEQARMVELRFFAGLENADVARVMGISTRTVERGWRLARAWLQRELGGGGGAG